MYICIYNLGKGDKVLYFPDTEAKNQITAKSHISENLFCCWFAGEGG